MRETIAAVERLRAPSRLKLLWPFACLEEPQLAALAARLRLRALEAESVLFEEPRDPCQVRLSAPPPSALV